MPHAKPLHRNYRIWKGLSGFLSGLVPMYHLSWSKNLQLGPCSNTHTHTHTHTHTFRMQLVVEVIWDKKRLFYHFAYLLAPWCVSFPVPVQRRRGKGETVRGNRFFYLLDKNPATFFWSVLSLSLFSGFLYWLHLSFLSGCSFMVLMVLKSASSFMSDV